MTAVAQDDHRNDKQDNAKPENRQDQPRPQEQARPENRNDERQKQEPKNGDRREMTPQNEGRQNQEPQSGDRRPQTRENDRQMQQPQERQNEQRQNQRSEQERQDPARPQGMEQGRADRRGGNQRRIPNSDFHAHFGHQHHFAPGRVQVYGGRPQFSYGGYVFELVEPWPGDWAYDDDDYYIDYVDDEYWLYNLREPGLRLELMIIG